MLFPQLYAIESDKIIRILHVAVVELPILSLIIRIAIAIFLLFLHLQCHKEHIIFSNLVQFVILEEFLSFGGGYLKYF